MLDSIATMVKDLLTSQRSNIKQKVHCQHSRREILIDRHAKLTSSLKSQSHISHLARTLAPGSHFEITLNHWARYTFLVCLHVIQLSNYKIWTSNEFWEFVDTLLSQTRVAAMAQESTVQGQQKILEIYTVVPIHCVTAPAHHPMMLIECLQSVYRLT